MTRFCFPLAILVVTAAASISGCAEALPRELPSKEVGDALLRAERAAQDATRAAQEAKTQADRNAELLAEAQDLARRAEAARLECARNLSRMQGIEEARKKAAKVRAVQVKKQEAAAALATPTATPELPKPNDPEYSPSDAPLH